MNQISIQEGINRFFDGEPVKMMVSSTGRFEDLRPVDAKAYLEKLFGDGRFMFFSAETTTPKHDPTHRAEQPKRYKKPADVKKKTPNTPGNREFDRLCRQQEETDDHSDEMIQAIERELIIYEEDDPHTDEGEWIEIEP